MTDKQIDELYGKGSLDKIKQYHKDASAVSTDSHDAKSYHDTSVRRTETLGKREKAKADIDKAKKGSTREKGWRNYLQAKDDSARQRKWSQKSRGELSSDEKRIHNTYLKARGVQEDAPTVNMGSGNIPGGGVAAADKPANFGDAIVSSGAAKQWKKQNAMFRRKSSMAEEQSYLPEETFAGAAVFEVSSHTFHNAKMEKRKGKHWRTYLDECDELSEIREYANRNPKRPIVLQNRNTNEMVYVRYGKGR